MTLYFLYRVGLFLTLSLPLGISYAVASTLADIYYLISKKDAEAVRFNLKVILGESASEGEIKKLSREVFRNFARYLLEFFRFSLVDDAFIRKYVKLENMENVDKALLRKKGAIALSAHIGNWEMGGVVLSLLRQPMGAVVLTHQNKRINDFFTKQRLFGNLKVIEIGMGLREGFKILRNNGLLALLGDRDFSKNGLYVDFFGRKTLIPKGPAVFCYRTGSAIVPCFLIRQRDGFFRFVFEEPIFPDAGKNEDSAIQELTQRYTSIIESYVRRYPDQWYIFRKVWNGDEGPVRPDTIL